MTTHQQAPRLTAEVVKTAILDWPGRYAMEDGTVFLGMPASQVPSQLSQAGWRNVSRLDEYDFEKMGLQVVKARYVGGGRPKKFCRVVVANFAREACRDIGSARNLDQAAFDLEYAREGRVV